VFCVPPVWVQFEVGRDKELLIGDAFNCETLTAAVAALRRAADALERMKP
jgi:hypothetical protein